MENSNQNPGTGEAPGANQNPGTGEGPGPETTEMEVVGPFIPYTDTFSDDETVKWVEDWLVVQTVEEASKFEGGLEALARYGRIAAARRQNAEKTGLQAQLAIAKSRIQPHVERFAIANLAAQALQGSIREAQNGQPQTMLVEVVIRVAGREVVISPQTIMNDYPTAPSKVGTFQNSVKPLIELIKFGAQAQYSKINSGEGHNHSLPFDWATVAAEIKNAHEAANGEQ